jgi:hypothetical protein
VTPEGPSVRERLGLAADQVMESGDHVVASTAAVSGPWAVALWAWQAVGVAGFLTLMVTHGMVTHGTVTHGTVTHGTLPGSGFLAWLPAYIVIGAALFARQRLFLLVVTGRVVICYRASRFTGAPGRLACTAPLPAVTVTVGRRSPLGRPVRIRAPGQRSPRLRLSARARWQDDSEEVIAALRASGGSLTGPQLPAGS